MMRIKELRRDKTINYTPNNRGYCCCPWRLKVNSHCWRHHTSGCRNWMIWGRLNMKSSFLWSSFHSTRKCFQRREAITGLSSYDAYEPQQPPAWQATPQVQQWHSHLDRNQQLLNWTERLLKPGARTQANYLGLMRPQIPEDDLQLSL